MPQDVLIPVAFKMLQTKYIWETMIKKVKKVS